MAVISKKVGYLVKIIADAIYAIIGLTKVGGLGQHGCMARRRIRDSAHVLVQEAVEILRKGLCLPEVQIFVCRIPRFGLHLDHVDDELADVTILNLAKVRNLGPVVPVAVLEQLAEREDWRFDEELGDHAADAEYVHGPRDASAIVLLASS